jgi:hypothetical protein
VVLAVCRPEVVLIPMGPVRQALREAAASFFIGRKGRLLRAAQPVLDHLRPGAVVQAKDLPALVEELAGIADEVQRLGDGWQSLLLSPAVPRPLNVLDPDHLRVVAGERGMRRGWHAFRTSPSRACRVLVAVASCCDRRPNPRSWRSWRPGVP